MRKEGIWRTVIRRRGWVCEKMSDIFLCMGGVWCRHGNACISEQIYPIESIVTILLFACQLVGPSSVWLKLGRCWRRFSNECCDWLAVTSFSLRGLPSVSALGQGIVTRPQPRPSNAIKREPNSVKFSADSINQYSINLFVLAKSIVLFEMEEAPFLTLAAGGMQPDFPSHTSSDSSGSESNVGSLIRFLLLR